MMGILVVESIGGILTPKNNFGGLFFDYSASWAQFQA